ncbi:MAG: DUF4440 domain-containing protein [Thermoanaerobaculia bacterium]
MRNWGVAVGALLCLGVVAIADAGWAESAKVDRAQEEAALRAADLAWSAAAGRKDVDAVAGFMTADGETLPPNEPAQRDAKSIRAGWAGLLTLPDAKIEWSPLRVGVAESGELGYTSGSYKLSFTGEDGKTVTDAGKYTEVWKKVGGQWKCTTDIYNSDLPLP